MGRSRILILGFAAGSAVLAAMLARGFLSPPPERQVVEVSKVATGDVLVAAADLPLGDKLTPANVAWHRWPKDAITPQMITREAKPDAPAELADARLRAPIFKGEPIGERKLVMPNSSGFMAAVLPKGMRAISVAITAETGAGGFILPKVRVATSGLVGTITIAQFYQWLMCHSWSEGHSRRCSGEAQGKQLFAIYPATWAVGLDQFPCPAANAPLANSCSVRSVPRRDRPEKWVLALADVLREPT